MTDFASFKHGNVNFPLALAATDGYSLLRACDPALFYALQFYASVINTHVGARLAEAAAAAGATQIQSAVAETLPVNPEPYLTDSHIRFPLLALYRKGTTFRLIGQRRVSVHKLELAYVLPPMTAAEAENILPILHSVEVLLDNRTEQGFDPAYTPSTPTGTAGEKVWSANRAGLVRVEMLEGQTGAYTPTADLFFPALILSLQMEERSEAVVTELVVFDGADVTVDLVSEDTTYQNIVAFSTSQAPVITALDVSTGSKTGTTDVVITGTGFVVGRPYRVFFGDLDASSVEALTTTTIACQTPAHPAYPTQAVDVVVMDQDSQVSNTLSGAFTFTSP